MYVLTIFVVANIFSVSAETKNSYGIIIDKIVDSLKLSNTESSLDDNSITSEVDWLKKYASLLNEENILRGFRGSLINENEGHSSEVSGRCESDVAYMSKYGNQTWAYRMLDAFGKPQSGVLNGNSFWLGDYDECVSTDVNERSTAANYTQNITFSGRYCLAKLNVTGVPQMFQWGLCVPSSCHSEDVSAELKYLLNVYPPISKRVNLFSVVCNQDSIPLTTGAIVCGVVLAVFGVMLLAGTLYDLTQHRPFWQSLSPKTAEETINNASITNATEDMPLLGRNTEKMSQMKPIRSKWHTFLMAFSVYNNTKKLFNTASSPLTVRGLNGFRALSLAWVILGHCFLFQLTYIRNMLSTLATLPKQASLMPLFSSFYSVDSFFFMSGLLVTYHLLNFLTDDPGRLRSAKTWILFLVHRFIRLTPFYMLILMIYMCLSQYWSDGPLSVLKPGDYDICSKYWWTNLLYINNFWKLSNQCLGWSWYLANDMQFYIISPVIIVALFLKPLAGFVGIAALLIMQVVYRGVVSAQYHLPLGEIYFSTNLTQMAKYLGSDAMFLYYTAPYSRIGPYLIGMITGYALYRSRGTVRLPKALVVLGWGLCLAVIFTLLYGGYTEVNGHLNPNSLNAVFNSINKTLWGIVAGWVIYTTHVGHGGIAGEILSWRGWTPIARLTYAAYLIHPILIDYFLYNMKSPIYYSVYNMVMLFFSQWVISYIFAFIASISLEVPLMGIEKMLLHR